MQMQMMDVNTGDLVITNNWLPIVGGKAGIVIEVGTSWAYVLFDSGVRSVRIQNLAKMNLRISK